MTDTIERMARAMCEADGFNWDDQLDPMKSANGDEDGEVAWIFKRMIKAAKGGEG